MKITGFDDAFTLLMGSEGGYSNNPADPGGETMWGVTKRVAVANGYVGPMKLLPLSIAKQIAKTEYWDKVRGDDLPPEIAFQIFDAVYNGGPAVQWLQQAVGVTVDGNLGPKTIVAVAACDERSVIMRFDAYRLRYLAKLKPLPTFAGGWMNRIAFNLIEGAD